MDSGVSVLAKLKSKSKVSGKPLQLLLQLFCQEEFLRKISLSKYADNLVLKGGLFLYMLTGFASRSTVDVDFLLRQLPSRIEDIQKIVDEILAVDTGHGFISFIVSGFETITPQRKYAGVSFQLIGRIKNTRTPFNVDFGIGDVIVPKSEKRIIPTQLDTFDAPEISTYSLESTVAEKFDAMLQRLELTSRMKDYYDIYYIACTFPFEGRKLQEAISQTLRNRGTDYDRDSFGVLMNFDQNDSMLIKWRKFLQRTELPDIEFNHVLTLMKSFLGGIWLSNMNNRDFSGQWNPNDGKWE